MNRYSYVSDYAKRHEGSQACISVQQPVSYGFCSTSVSYDLYIRVTRFISDEQIS